MIKCTSPAFRSEETRFLAVGVMQILVCRIPIRGHDWISCTLSSSRITTIPYSLIRQQVAEVLVKIGGEEINTRLLILLADKRVDQNVQSCIAKAFELGDRSVAPDLLRIPWA
jgi:hypothetical protein